MNEVIEAGKNLYNLANDKCFIKGWDVIEALIRLDKAIKKYEEGRIDHE